MSVRNARQTIEQTVRDSYGRLVSFLAVRWRDLTAAEDALADAFLAALENWPATGVPDKPEAWLLTVARRRLIDGTRHARVQAGAKQALLTMAEGYTSMDRDIFPGRTAQNAVYLCPSRNRPCYAHAAYAPVRTRP